jgi:hypothetical protein
LRNFEQVLYILDIVNIVAEDFVVHNIVFTPSMGIPDGVFLGEIVDDRMDSSFYEPVGPIGREKRAVTPEAFGSPSRIAPTSPQDADVAGSYVPTPILKGVPGNLSLPPMVRKVDQCGGADELAKGHLLDRHAILDKMPRCIDMGRVMGKYAEAGCLKTIFRKGMRSFKYDCFSKAAIAMSYGNGKIDKIRHLFFSSFFFGPEFKFTNSL